MTILFYDCLKISNKFLIAKFIFILLVKFIQKYRQKHDKLTQQAVFEQ